jgi:hypothetical protein
MDGPAVAFAVDQVPDDDPALPVPEQERAIDAAPELNAMWVHG